MATLKDVGAAGGGSSRPEGAEAAAAGGTCGGRDVAGSAVAASTERHVGGDSASGTGLRAFVSASGLRRRFIGGRAGAGAGGAGGAGGAPQASATPTTVVPSADASAAPVPGADVSPTTTAAATKSPTAGTGAAAKVNDDDKSKDDAPDVTTAEALRFAWPWLLPRTAKLRLFVLLSLLCELAAKACNFVQPLLLRYAMNGLALAAAGHDEAGTPSFSNSAAPAPLLLLGRWALPVETYERPVTAIVGYMATGYLVSILSYGQGLAWERATQNMVSDLRVATLAHLHSLDLMWHLNRHTPQVLNIMFFGVRAAMSLLSLVSFDVVPTVADFCMTLVVLARLGSRAMATLALVSVAVYGVMAICIRRILLRQQKERVKQRIRNSGRDFDSLFDYENVKIFCTEAVEVRRYRTCLKEQQQQSNQWSLVQSALQHGQALVRSVAVSAGLVLAGRRVMDGSLSLSDFVAVQTYLGRLFQPVNFMTRLHSVFSTTMLSLCGLVALHKKQPTVIDAPDAVPLVLCPTPTSRGGAMRFEGVSFHYGADSAGAIHDVSFTVPAGGTCAIVGPTGSGKTTLMRLAMRLFDVTGGKITIDGQDIAGVTQRSLREAIGVVAQDTSLITRESLRHNIAYGRGGGEDVPDAAVAAAVNIAQLTDWVSRLPKGLDSMCGERGVRLSGGEKQRVGIARVAIREPAILLLDESTSSLDSETEAAMQAALRAATRATTTIIVAHRLATVVAADEILVLHEGRIVERGSHTQLVRREGGRYRRMWELQQRGFVVRSAKEHGGDPPSAGAEDAAVASTASMDSPDVGATVGVVVGAACSVDQGDGDTPAEGDTGSVAESTAAAGPDRPVGNDGASPPNGVGGDAQVGAETSEGLDASVGCK